MVASIEVKALEIDPSISPITSPVSISIVYESNESFSGFWSLSYIVDFANERHVIDILKSSNLNIEKGTNKFSTELPILEIEKGSISKKLLKNVGLLTICLNESNTSKEEVIQISVVAQIDKQSNGTYQRTLFNPME